MNADLVFERSRQAPCLCRIGRRVVLIAQRSAVTMEVF